MKLSDLRKRELSPEPTREEYVATVKAGVYNPGGMSATDFSSKRPWGLENIIINSAQMLKYRLDKKGSAIPERLPTGFETKVGRDADGLYIDLLWRPPWPIRSIDNRGNTHTLSGFRIYAKDLDKYRVGY